MAGMIGGITQTAMSTVGTIFSAIAGMKWDKEMDKLKEKDPRYTSSPYAANNLGMAQQLLNSRMAGANARERNIQTSGANVRAGIGRNATDSSQALALMAGTQGMEGQQYNDLAIQEGQDAYQKQNNLFNANKDMTVEHKDLFDDEVRRWQDQVNMITAQYKARKQGGSDIGQLGSGLSSMGGGLGGGGGMGGGGGSYTGGGGFTGTGGTSAGGGMGGGMGLPSDKRLKHNYHVIGKSPSGINIYEFSYIGSNTRFIGAMANEVPQAAVLMDNGFYAVDYNKIDVPFKQVSL